VRMSTQETWGVGTVWAIDVWHAPFGVSFCVFLLSLSLSRVGHVDVLPLLYFIIKQCSVWPALWTFSPNSTWPSGG